MLASLRVPALSSEEAVGTTSSTLMAHAVPLGPISTLQEQNSAVRWEGRTWLENVQKMLKQGSFYSAKRLSDWDQFLLGPYLRYT